MAEKEQNEVKFGVAPRMVPNPTAMPDVGEEMMNKRTPLSMSEPSLNSATERMGAATPWISKAGHAVAAANAKDPGNDTPSMKFVPASSPGYVVGRTPKSKPGGPGNGYAGQANAGGYEGASGNGGYS